MEYFVKKTNRGDFMAFADCYQLARGPDEASMIAVMNERKNRDEARALEERIAGARAAANERRISTPGLVARNIRLSRMLHEAYQGVCIAIKREGEYSRHLSGNPRNAGRIAEAGEEMISAEAIYNRAAAAHHAAAVARHSGEAADWSTALDTLEQELEKFRALQIYGCVM